MNSFDINSNEKIIDLGCGRYKRTKGGRLVSKITEDDYFTMLWGQLGRRPTEAELAQVWREFPLRKVIGIDKALDRGVDISCNLGYDKIPIEDNWADYVLAHDFVEHIPFEIKSQLRFSSERFTGS